MRKGTLLCVILFILLFTSYLFSGVISPQLEEKLNEIGKDDFVKVNMVMAEQPDFITLMDMVKGKEVSERRDIVIDYLKEIRNQSQKRILAYLDEMKDKGKVERVRSLWLGNAVCLTATKEVVEEVSQFLNVAYVDWDEEQYLLIHSRKSESSFPDGRELVWNVSKVRADLVWGLGYTGTGIIVSVIDTGVRYTHWDLADHIWTNPREIPNNGIDDDGNGYTDDYYGYDFYNNDGNPMDDRGHGTHCAGTVSSDGTAGSQCGVAPDAPIMSLKVLSSSGNGNESDVWEAIQYTVDMGARIISMSLGWQHSWGPNRQQWRNMTNIALAAGVFMSVAAGNEGNQQGTYPIPDNVRTPGDCPPPWLHPDQTLIGGLSAVVTIGATDINDNIAGFSSRGPVTWEAISPWNDYPYNPEMGLIDPDVCAPGVNIKSLSYSGDNQYASGWDGTSMATPHVAGAVALMLSKSASAGVALIDSILEVTAIELGSAGKDNTFGSGRIDCYDAVVALPSINQVDIYYVSNQVNDPGGNNNGKLDPGETIDLVVTLRNNGGLDATNVVAKLRESNTYITVPDSEATFGNISQGATADNSSNPYVITASPSTPIGEIVNFTLFITCAEGDTFYRNFNLTIGTPGVPYADHDVGNVIFTVTSRGACGYMDDSQSQGSGFRYPYNSASSLFIGSAWVGNASNYVVNADYSAEGSPDWEVSTSPDGLVQMGATVYSNQDGWAMYTDAGMSAPKDIYVTQNSWAWANHPYDDFVIMVYWVENKGSSAVNGIYVGHFMDIDITAYNDYGAVNSGMRMAYIYEPGGIYVGTKLLDPTTATNLFILENATYVYPNSHILDSDKILMLNGSITNTTGTNDDWSTMVSAGPFNINPNETIQVAFAIIGGDNQGDLEQNGDTAQYKYDSMLVAVEEPTFDVVPKRYYLPGAYPNPVSNGALIKYQLPRKSEVRLCVYDISGRLVDVLVDGVMEAGYHSMRLNTKSYASGVYFYRLIAGGNTFTRKMIVVK